MSLVLTLLLAASPADAARARLDAAGLELAGPLTEEDVVALASGLDALPESFRKVPAERLRLVLDDSLPPSAAGIAEPEWRGRDFVLTPQQGSVMFRDQSLEEGARRRLWRARAVVHALLAAWDDVHRWSQDPRWRRANGWLLAFERPLAFREYALNQATTAFARPRGKASSRLDFLTFAESALVPVETLAPDDLVRCQEFTRLRALGALLGTGWAPGACPAFDAWVRDDELEHVEVLFVQASGRAPESLFGHLLVRPVWRSSLGPSFDSAIQFAAITLPTLGPAHLARGLFGGYSLGVFTISMTDLTREKLSGEQRSMTRWKLGLSRHELRRFLERTWEFERRGRFSYAFFSDNCASMLVWMLEGVLDEPALASWPGFITSPGGVLDDLFRAKKKSGERLLSPVFPTFESTGVVAQRDEAKRRQLEAHLASALPVDFSGAHDAEPSARTTAYGAIERASREAPATLHGDLFAWWALSARVERASADEALHSLRELDQQRLEPGSDDLEAMWTERLASLERETTIQAHLMLLDRETFMEDVRRTAKKRDLTPAEVSKQGEHEAKLALFDEVTRLQGGLVSDVFPGESASAFLAAEAEAVLAAEVPPAARSLPVSGHFRTGVGVGAWRRADGLVAPVVRVDEAGLLELLGEQRHRGVGAPAGVRVLEGSVTLSPTSPSPVVQSHFTLVAFDSLAPPVPPAPRWKDVVGFGFEVVSDYRAWRSQHSLAGVDGWVLLGVRGDHSRNLLAVGVGPAAWAATDATGLMPMGGVTSRVLARVGLQPDWPSALRLEARHQSVWGPGRQLHELRADVSLEWVLAWRGRPRLLLRPTASLTAEPVLGRLDVLALLMVEPVESLAAALR